MQIDDELSLVSTNPVQNKVVTAAMNDKQDISNLVTSVSSSSTNTQYISAKYIQDMLVAKLSMTIDDIIAQRGTYYYAWEVTIDSTQQVIGYVYALVLTPNLSTHFYTNNNGTMEDISDTSRPNYVVLDSISGDTIQGHMAMQGSGLRVDIILTRTPLADIIIK